MKRKSLIFMLAAALVVILSLSIVACNTTTKPDPDNKKNDKISLKPLPDMVDYGADSAYYKEGSTTYSDTKKAEWTDKLTEKLTSEREDWLLEGEVWADDNYYSFGPIAVGYGQSVAERQSNIGYYNAAGEWIDDESANTVERVFCYSSPADFIERMSSARLDEDKMDMLVDYICRTDEDRTKGTGYTYTKGTSSAIEDYNQLDELYDIYDDFDAYKDDSSYATPKFESEDDVSDAVSRKRRKIFGEIIDIYGDKGDQFARSAIEIISYALEILDNKMITSYNTNFGREVNFIDYMRNEIYDYETLSYLEAFKERTSFDTDTHKVVSADKKAMMTLYGYYYQYEKGEYGVFDDSVTVAAAGGITEYEDYLKLSHKDYYNSDAETIRNRDYDRRIYEKAYRYSYACYKKYYSAQLAFQKIQEEKDLTIYVGGAVKEADMGNSELKGQYKSGLTKVDSSTSYSQQMQLGCDVGLESTLKLSDVNWEYTGDDKKVLQYNTASRNWNSLSETEQASPRQKIKEVKLELEQLKSQDYAINHTTISETDLTQALQYEIRSYSADSIRGIQACKKDEVIYYKDIDRFFKVDANSEYTFTELLNDTNTSNEYRRNALLELEENAGRNDAKYVNLNANYSVGTADEQVKTAESTDWKGVKSNIKETLSKDYEAYAKDTSNKKDVSEYFENTLIRKKYSCDADLDDLNCKNNNGHQNCTEKYDTEWALSRLLHNHETVIRYASGQYQVTFYSLTNQSIIAADVFAFTMDSVTTMTSREAVVKGVYGKVSYNGNDVTLDYNDEIGTVCRDTGNDGYKDVDLYLTQYWKNVPSYETNSFDYDKKTNVIKVTKGGHTYTYTFIGWFVDENFKYRVNLDDAYNYDLRLYPAYRVERIN